VFGELLIVRRNAAVSSALYGVRLRIRTLAADKDPVSYRAASGVISAKRPRRERR